MGKITRDDTVFRELGSLLSAMQKPQHGPARLHYVQMKPLLTKLEEGAEGRAANPAIRERLFDLDLHARMLAGLESDGHPPAYHGSRAVSALNVLRKLFAKSEPPKHV